DRDEVPGAEAACLDRRRWPGNDDEQPVTISSASTRVNNSGPVARGLAGPRRARHTRRRMRRTRIGATIGPASRDPRMLEELLRAGVDVVRLNFSHGEPAEHRAVLLAAREIAARLGRPLAILQDLSGPKIRTGRIGGGGVLDLQ